MKKKYFFNYGQFGFKSNISTYHASILIKEIVQHYSKNKKKRVFSLFADFSKAFDRVDHFKLGDMLIDRGVPSDVVHLILFYLRNQKVRVRWELSTGNFKYINVGLRLRGILSPFLFK